MLQVAARRGSGQCWVMEHETTYPAHLAQRVAGLSASQDDHDAPHLTALKQQPRIRRKSLAVLASAGLVAAGVWSGFHVSAASPSADPVAATSVVSSPIDDVAAGSFAPLLGAGVLRPTTFVVLETSSPVDLLPLVAGAVIPAETPVFATNPDGSRLPFDTTILAIDPAARRVSLMHTDAYTLVLPIAEAQLHRVALGDTAEVQFDALPGQSFAATVSALAPMVTPGRGTVDVSLALQDPPSTLRPHMAARIALCGCPNVQPSPENG